MDEKMLHVLAVCRHYDAVNFWGGVCIGFVGGAVGTALFLWLMG